MIQRAKEAIRSAALAIPGGTRVYRWLAKGLAKRRFKKMFPELREAGDAATIFDRMYHANSWGSAETPSGPGSTLAFTAGIRAELPKLLASLSIDTLLDAPCGDLNWMRAVGWETRVSYIGGDISPAVIARNEVEFAETDRIFQVLDIRHDDLPAADLWLCRDCLFHLPERDVFAVLRNFARHRIPYLLTSCHTDCRINTDAPTGGFRLLNLELPPYGLGPPVLAIEDWAPGQTRRHLALWRREQVAKAIGWREQGASRPNAFPRRPGSDRFIGSPL